ncbi:MAG: class I SAM-dependent methyltransferase [Microthrixaceae bacterium]
MTRPCPICGEQGSAEIWAEDGWKLVRCPTCDLVFVGNPPEDDSVGDLYTAPEFHAELTTGDADGDSIAERTARGHLGDMERAGAAPRPGRNRLLDVGSAAGHFLGVARDAGWLVHGVELNDATANIARNRGFDVLTGTIGDLVDHRATGDNDLFDVVTMWDVIEHVTDPVQLLEQTRDLLSPEGELWIATPNVDGLFPRASYRVARRAGRWPHPEPPYHLSQFSERTMRNALARAGFPDVTVRQERIPLSYTFGKPRTVLAEPLRLAYSAVFAPIAVVGPYVNRGDTMVLRARPARGL